MKPGLPSCIAALVGAGMLLFASGCTTTPPPAMPSLPVESNAAPTFPGAAWQAWPAPEAGSACQSDLLAARDFVRTLDTTALMAVQDGRVLFSEGPVERVSIVFSVRKSILAMLYGKYVASGAIDLGRTLADMGIDDAVGGLLPTERQARLRDLLAARSGVYHPAANGGDDAAAAPARGSQAPGSYFLYNNWDFNAAGTAFERLTGRGIYQAFADDLAVPLQLEDFDPARHARSGNAGRSEHLAYPFFLSTRDMARLGYLMLREGNWRGRQLIPADWVGQMTRQTTPAAQMHPAHTARRGFGYGYLWWLLEKEPPDSPLHGAYMAWGVHGQYILIVPKRSMVIAHKRQVPVAGHWDVSWVGPSDFLHAARMLAAAQCGAVRESFAEPVRQWMKPGRQTATARSRPPAQPDHQRKRHSHGTKGKGSPQGPPAQDGHVPNGEVAGQPRGAYQHESHRDGNAQRHQQHACPPWVQPDPAPQAPMQRGEQGQAEAKGRQQQPQPQQCKFASVKGHAPWAPVFKGIHLPALSESGPVIARAAPRMNRF